MMGLRRSLRDASRGGFKGGHLTARSVPLPQCALVCLVVLGEVGIVL